MPVSKAQQKATNKWIEKTYDRINLTVPKGQKAIIKTHAESRGESVNAFLNRAAQETMRRDNAAPEAAEAAELAENLEAAIGTATQAAETAVDSAASAEEAADSAIEAAASALAAKTSATEAATSATQAASSATQAAQSVVDVADVVDVMTNNVPKKTVSGQVVSGDDAYRIKPFGLKVYGETRQNLWANPSGASKGVTVTSNDDGSITVDGTSTALSSIYINKKVYTLKPNTVYTFSVDKLPEGFGFVVREDDSLGQSIISHAIISSTDKSVQFTTMENAESALLYVAVNAGASVSGTYRVMLNEGDTAEPWCPPGLNSVGQLREDEKNLWVNPATETKNGITLTSNADGSVSIKGTSTRQSYFNMTDAFSLKPSTEYTFSVDNLSAGFNVVVREDSDSQTNLAAHSLEGSIKSLTFTTFSNMAKEFFFIGVAPGRSFDITLHVMLNEGSTPAPWVPPGCETAVQVAFSAGEDEPIALTPIDLDGHVLASLPDGTRDELVVGQDGTAEIKKAVLRTDLSTTEWTNNSKSTSYISATNKKMYYSGTIDPSTNLCSTLVTTNRGNESMPPYSVKIASSNPNGSVVGKWLNADQGNDAFQAAVRAIGGEHLGRLADVETVSIPSVSLPALPAPNFNAWVQDDIPAEMELNYVQDVNLMFERIHEVLDAFLGVDGD